MIFKFFFKTKLDSSTINADFAKEPTQEFQEENLEDDFNNEEQNKSKKDDFSEMFADKRGILTMIALFIFFIAIILTIYFWRFFK